MVEIVQGPVGGNQKFRPALTGFLAGLLAGGLGAAAYAANCPDDSPLFVMTWYPVGILALGAIGALAGSRVLRW